MVNLIILFEVNPRVRLQEMDLRVLNTYLRSYDMHVHNLSGSDRGYRAALEYIYNRIRDVLTNECASLHPTTPTIRIAPYNSSMRDRPYTDPVWVNDRMIHSQLISPFAWESALKSVVTGPSKTIVALVEVVPYSTEELKRTAIALGATPGNGNMSLLQTLPPGILENIARLAISPENE